MRRLLGLCLLVGLVACFDAPEQVDSGTSDGSQGASSGSPSSTSSDTTSTTGTTGSSVTSASVTTDADATTDGGSTTGESISFCDVFDDPNLAWCEDFDDDALELNWSVNTEGPGSDAVISTQGALNSEPNGLVCAIGEAMTSAANARRAIVDDSETTVVVEALVRIDEPCTSSTRVLAVRFLAADETREYTVTVTVTTSGAVWIAERNFPSEDPAVSYETGATVEVGVPALIRVEVAPGAVMSIGVDGGDAEEFGLTQWPDVAPAGGVEVSVGLNTVSGAGPCLASFDDVVALTR